MLSLAQANAIIAAAFVEGDRRGLKPLTVVVTDPGGHIIAVQRQDGASLLRPKIAHGKAAGALALGISSRAIGEMAADRPAFIMSIAQLSDGALVPVAGGVIIAGSEGAALGAVGVSGDTSDNDERCALAALAVVGLYAR